MRLLKWIWITIVNVYNGFAYGLGIKKAKPPIYIDSDEDGFFEAIPDNQAFVFVVSERDVNPWKQWWFDFMDFLRGAIQGVTRNYWQHSGIGIKKQGRVLILESLNKIELGVLDKYTNDKHQMILYFPPLVEDAHQKLWQRAVVKQGGKYDNVEFVRHISPFFKWLFPNDKNIFVCGSYSAWAFDPYYPITPKKVGAHETVPGHIDKKLRADAKVFALPYNLKLRRDFKDAEN